MPEFSESGLKITSSSAAGLFPENFKRIPNINKKN